MKRVPFCVLVLFLFNILILNAQIKDIGIPFNLNYTRQIYKAGSQNWDIAQDKRGFMYFANNDGILEFDGSNWQIYKVSNQSIVRSVTLGDDGKIYAGASHEIGYLEADPKGKLQYHSLLALIPNKFQNFDEVWKVYQTYFGMVFQSYKYIFIYKNGAIQTIRPPVKFDFSFYTGGVFYAVDKDKGIFILQNGKLIPFINNSAFADNEIRFILPYRTNQLLIGTINKGIFVLKGNTIVPWNTKVNEMLISNRLFTGIEPKGGEFAFGSIQDGLYIADGDGNIIQHLDRLKGLPNNTILSLFADSSNNLWMGLDNGISFSDISSPFTIFNFYYGIETGYTSIVFNNVLYIGTNQGLFAKPMDQLSNKAGADSRFKLIDGSQGQVWCLTQIGDKLFCGHNDGAYIVEGYSLKQISNVRGCWTFVQPVDDKNKIISGTYKGLILFEKENNRSDNWKFSQRIKGFDESCKVLVVDTDNTLWMSHAYRGIYHLTLNAAMDSVVRVRHFTTGDGLPEKLPFEISRLNNEIIITSSKGIYSYNRIKEKFEPSSKYNSFFRINTNLDRIILDPQSNIWYFTSNEMGVYRRMEDDTYKEIYTPFLKFSNTLISSYQHVYVYDNKNIFIGTEDGTIHYDPSLTKDYNQPFSAYIREVRILKPGNDSVLAYEGNSSTQNSFFHHKVNLHYRNNSLMFKFTAPSYEDPEKTEYRCRLIGFEDGFSPWVSRNIKEYTNLHEGAYTFEVQARNLYQKESAVDRFTFYVYPPIYRSKLAYLVYITLIGFSVFYTVKRIKNARRRLTLMHAKKMIVREQQFKEESLLAEKEIERLRNETLQNEMKHKNKELANSTMNLIQKNKFLMAIKNEIVNITGQVTENSQRSSLTQIIKRIDKDISNEKYWKVFDSYFDEVHQDFLSRMKEKHPDLSPKELKLSAYLRMNISTKEIATLMNISIRGVEVSRYRLRKKLNIEHDMNLTEYILNF